MTGPPAPMDAEMVVVFDTNAYLDLVKGLDLAGVDRATSELTRAERLIGIQALGNPFVMQELIARLNDPSGPGHKRSELALIALGGHCRYETPSGPRFGFVHDAATIIATYLYGRKPQLSVQWTGRIIELTSLIAEVRPPQLPGWATNRIAQVSEHVEEVEKSFEEMMYRYAVKGANPNAIDWDPLRNDPVLRAQSLAYIESPGAAFRFGDMLLQQALDSLEIEETHERRLEFAAWVAEKFQTPHRLFNEILRRIFATGCNLAKPHRRNWVWDIFIACSTGAEHTIQGSPIRLVTSDRDILTAAGRAGCGELVQSYPDYRSGLERDSTAASGDEVVQVAH